MSQQAVSLEVISQVEQFLYREARMLDERRFEEWFDIFTDDARYWMPLRKTRRSEGQTEDWDVEKELSGAEELAFFDDSKLTLMVRTKRVRMAQNWAEDPPSRTRRIVTNIEVEAKGSDEWLVHSCFLLHRTRMENDKHVFVGQRRDLLQRAEDGFKIKERRIVLDSNVLQAPNLSVFF